jgi:hypothetical protein
MKLTPTQLKNITPLVNNLNKAKLDLLKSVELITGVEVKNYSIRGDELTFEENKEVISEEKPFTKTDLK